MTHTPTPEQFLKFHTSYHGEVVDNLKQIVTQCFTGEELFEFCTAYANHVLMSKNDVMERVVAKENGDTVVMSQEDWIDIQLELRKLAALQEESVLANSKISLLESQITDLQKEVDENGYDLPSDIKLQRIKDAVRFTIQKYSELVTDLEQKLTDAKDMVKIDSGIIESLNQEVDELRQQLTDARKEIEGLKIPPPCDHEWVSAEQRMKMRCTKCNQIV